MANLFPMKRIAWAAAVLPILLVLAACGGGSNGQSEGLDMTFTPPAPYSLQQLAQQPYRCGKENEQCAISYLQQLTTRYGPQASLDILGTLESSGKIDPTFDTHQLAHLVGEATAKRFGANKQAFGLCPQTFNYGCVHGFFIYVLGRSADPTKAATTICDSGGKGPLVPTFNCWHGVGHGVMMARGNDLQASLDVCDSLGSPSAADGCWQGVFMENVNAEFRNQARPGVFSRTAPLRPCTRMLDAYKHECFINQAGWLASLANDDIGKASRYCLSAPREYVSACAQSIGLMVTNPSWQAPFFGPAKGTSFEQVSWDLCTRFPAKLQRDCVLGGVDNLANFDQLEVKRSDGFCALTGKLAAPCFREIGVNLIRRTDVATARARCADLSSHRADCVAGITQGQLPSAPVTVPKVKPRQQQEATGKPTATVRMTDSGYSPKVLKIKQGQTVEFVNDSKTDYWPASDPHPTHTDYPGFDAQKTILPGKSWDFTFNRTGTYGYHNHLAPETHAEIVISKAS
jgi:plastocyanin